jgi:hypothetical protein
LNNKKAQISDCFYWFTKLGKFYFDSPIFAQSGTIEL